ncbi:arsinothricin biosynthesis radical SAM protein ArsL [Actinokineospora sp. 24-640]
MTPKALVVSPFEAEMQPLVSACAAAALRDAGAEVSAWDAHVFPRPEPVGRFDLVLIGVGQYEGLERGLALAKRLRAEDKATYVVTFGQYAQMNSGEFTAVCDGVLFDEPEKVADALVAAAAGSIELSAVPALLGRHGLNPKPPNRRMKWSLPARELFPSIVHYGSHHTPFGLMGNIEATRGCHHKCTYCSVFGAYDGGVAPIDIEPVVADALQLAEEGVRHFCFIDAEFFNSRKLGLEVVERVTAEVGPCTFEMTTRVDHILDYTAELERLVELGLRRVTSALEFPSDRILRIFDKGIDMVDTRRAITEAARIGFEINPTFIPFTPWTGYDELLTFEDFLVETGLSKTTHPTALQTRLLLFKGSPLLGSPWMDGIETVDRGFYVEWKHPDPRVEALWVERRQNAEDVGAVRCCVKC